MRISAAPRTLGRRAFIETGVAGAALLLAGRWLWQPVGAVAADAPALRYLGSPDVLVLQRVAPVVLEGALPEDPAARASALAEVVQGIDFALHHLSPAVRAEVADLFRLLTGSVTRALVAGVWTSWDRASTEEVRDFLGRWRASRFALLRSGYLGLQQLIVGSWYGNPRSWPRIGYGGPPGLAGAGA